MSEKFSTSFCLPHALLQLVLQLSALQASWVPAAHLLVCRHPWLEMRKEEGSQHRGVAGDVRPCRAPSSLGLCRGSSFVVRRNVSAAGGAGEKSPEIKARRVFEVGEAEPRVLKQFTEVKHLKRPTFFFPYAEQQQDPC